MGSLIERIHSTALLNSPFCSSFYIIPHHRNFGVDSGKNSVPKVRYLGKETRKEGSQIGRMKNIVLKVRETRRQEKE